MTRPGRRRAKRARLPASVVPLRCLVLAVDTAARSGWAAVAGRDEYLAFGEADTGDGAHPHPHAPRLGSHANLGPDPDGRRHQPHEQPRSAGAPYRWAHNLSGLRRKAGAELNAG